MADEAGGGDAGSSGVTGGDAAAAWQLSDMRSVHLLRRTQGRLPPVSLLLRNKLQHSQQAIRLLLLHTQILQLLRLQSLNAAELSPHLFLLSLSSQQSQVGKDSKKRRDCCPLLLFNFLRCAVIRES